MANEETIEGNQSIESGQSINMDNDLLGRLCHEAHQETYAKARGCSGCVRFFAFRLGVFLPGTCDYISDGRANALIDFMNSNWTKITKDEALFQARVGKLVVCRQEGGYRTCGRYPTCAERTEKQMGQGQAVSCLLFDD